MEETICSLCLIEEPNFKRSCGHNFCIGCMTKWYKCTKGVCSCPNCRKPILESEKTLLPKQCLDAVKPELSNGRYLGVPPEVRNDTYLVEPENPDPFLRALRRYEDYSYDRPDWDDDGLSEIFGWADDDYEEEEYYNDYDLTGPSTYEEFKREEIEREKILEKIKNELYDEVGRRY
jgi:hypothetical protein